MIALLIAAPTVLLIVGLEGRRAGDAWAELIGLTGCAMVVAFYLFAGVVTS